MRDEVRLIHRDDVLLLAAYGDVFFQCWTGEGRAADVKRMFDVHSRFVDEHGKKTTVAISHVLTPSIRPPDEPSRKIMNEHVQLLQGVRAVATVIEADGFAAAMIRGIVAGLVLLTKREVAHGVFSKPRDGLAFVLPHRDPTHGPMDLDTVDAAYARLRARTIG